MKKPWLIPWYACMITALFLAVAVAIVAADVLSWISSRGGPHRDWRAGL